MYKNICLTIAIVMIVIFTGCISWLDTDTVQIESDTYTGKMEHYIVTGEILRMFYKPSVGEVRLLNQQYGSLFTNNMVYAILNHMMPAVLAGLKDRAAYEGK